MRGILIALEPKLEGAGGLIPPLIGRSAGGYGKEPMSHNGLRIRCPGGCEQKLEFIYSSSKIPVRLGRRRFRLVD